MQTSKTIAISQVKNPNLKNPFEPSEINDNDLNAYIYPNPTIDSPTLYFNLEQTESNVKVDLFDASGRFMATSFDGTLIDG